MKFAVGYQLPEEGEESIVEVVKDHRDRIWEVYFPWINQPSGRAALNTRRGYTDWDAQRRLERDLQALRKLGVRLDLLFNANCYGGLAVSEYLANEVISVLDHLGEVVGGVDTVTTTSLAIAHTIKKVFPQVEVRASVNMRLGTVQAMQYAADYFDGYYVQREYNRDFKRLKQLKGWADRNGKKLYLLANSGCLGFCPGQIFHDNMVAHEQEIDEVRNIPGWTPHVCWHNFKDPARWPAVLQGSWIRPENLHHYKELFPVVKLATRMHSRPRAVVEAYIEEKYYGNLLDLFEPGFSPAFAPYVLDNQSFPKDWFEKTTTCGRSCDTCSYCAQVLEQIMVKIEDF